MKYKEPWYKPTTEEQNKRIGKDSQWMEILYKEIKGAAIRSKPDRTSCITLADSRDTHLTLQIHN
jgi:hypothetical protein